MHSQKECNQWQKIRNTVEKNKQKRKNRTRKKGRVQQNHTSFKVENRVALHVPFIKAVQIIKSNVDKLIRKSRRKAANIVDQKFLLIPWRHVVIAVLQVVLSL